MLRNIRDSSFHFPGGVTVLLRATLSSSPHQKDETGLVQNSTLAKRENSFSNVRQVQGSQYVHFKRLFSNSSACELSRLFS